MPRNFVHDTHPLILHAHGATVMYGREIFEDARADALSYTGGNSPVQCDELCIITYNNLDRPGLVEQILSMRGVPYLVAGADLMKKKKWFQLAQKPLYTMECIEKNPVIVPYIMGIDDYDIVPLGTPRQWLDRFLQADCDILYHGSNFFSPDIAEIHAAKSFEEKNGIAPWHYLNGGGFIGKREAVIEFMSQYRIRNNASQEQAGLHTLYMKWFPRVKIDCRCTLFQSLRNLSGKDFTL